MRAGSQGFRVESSANLTVIDATTSPLQMDRLKIQRPPGCFFLPIGRGEASDGSNHYRMATTCPAWLSWQLKVTWRTWELPDRE